MLNDRNVKQPAELLCSALIRDKADKPAPIPGEALEPRESFCDKDYTKPAD